MRYPLIDILRAIAIILMISFHTWYLANREFGYEFFLLPENIWTILGKISAIAFLLLAGMSYALAEKKYGKNIPRKYFFVSIKLAIFALGITSFTYFFFSDQLIVFGILHFFALSFFLLPYVMKTSLQISGSFIIILILGIYFLEDIFTGTQAGIILGFPGKDFFSADYYPLFPYFLYIFVGGHLGRYLISSGKIKYFTFGEKYKLLQYIGRKSLIIYLLHQPIIFLAFLFIEFSIIS